MKHKLEIDGYIDIARRTMEMPSATGDDLSRLDIMKAATEHPCVCDSTLIDGLRSILERNRIDEQTFIHALKGALHEGPNKYSNIMIYGEANTGKTTLISPLFDIFKNKTFVVPSAATTMPLINILGKKIALFNDFRWNKTSKIQWQDLLNLLESRDVIIGMPKNMGVRDVVFKSDVPFIITGSILTICIHG